MKKSAVLFINGNGGHATEMKSLLKYLSKDIVNYHYDTLINLGSPIYDVLCQKNIYLPDIRHKNSLFITLVSILPVFIYTIFVLFFLSLKFNVVATISTGPGLCIFPSYFFKFFFQSKVIFFESNCHFYNKSLTGKLMYKFSDIFIVQNKELCNVYPSSIYLGRL
jgi:beta-1,4-N-acetylglucosaminyltransferase